MTQSPETEVRRCRWCGGSFPAGSGPGRPRDYCRRSHRQRAYEARLVARRHRLGDDDVLIGRRVYEGLRDALYQIEAALDDVDGDLRSGAGPEEHRAALWHLYRSAAAVRGLVLEPKAVG